MLLSIGVICKYVSGRLPDHQSSLVGTLYDERDGPPTPPPCQPSISGIPFTNRSAALPFSRESRSCCRLCSTTAGEEVRAKCFASGSAGPRRRQAKCGSDLPSPLQQVKLISPAKKKNVWQRDISNKADTLRLNRKCHLAATADDMAVTRRGISNLEQQPSKMHPAPAPVAAGRTLLLCEGGETAGCANVAAPPREPKPQVPGRRHDIKPADIPA